MQYLKLTSKVFIGGTGYPENVVECVHYHTPIWKIYNTKIGVQSNSDSFVTFFQKNGKLYVYVIALYDALRSYFWDTGLLIKQNMQ